MAVNQESIVLQCFSVENLQHLLLYGPCVVGLIVSIRFDSITLRTISVLFQFINLGVKMLSRSESKGVDCEFRLVQDVSG